MRYTLRVQVHADGRWTYHLGHAGFVTDCGAPEPANAATEAEEASALRAILGHDEGDATWCPDCLRTLAGHLTRSTDVRRVLKVHADPPPDYRNPKADGRGPWTHRRAAEAEAIDPDPEGSTA